MRYFDVSLFTAISAAFFVRGFSRVISNYLYMKYKFKTKREGR